MIYTGIFLKNIFILFIANFYNIPAEGTINSHEYLVRVSGQYINAENFDQNLEPLIAEIDSLRATNLELERRITELITSGSL